MGAEEALGAVTERLAASSQRPEKQDGLEMVAEVCEAAIAQVVKSPGCLEGKE